MEFHSQKFEITPLLIEELIHLILTFFFFLPLQHVNRHVTGVLHSTWLALKAPWPIFQLFASNNASICRITLIDNEGLTPLHRAALNNHSVVVQYLLEQVTSKQRG